MELRLIAAIGKYGQIGFEGKLPWEKNKADLPWFKQQTTGHVVVFGWNTWSTLPEISQKSLQDGSRKLIVLYRPESLGLTTNMAASCIEDWKTRYNGEIVYICGGAKTYRLFAPYYNKYIITQIDYDGPADSWFPIAEIFPTPSTKPPLMKPAFAFTPDSIIPQDFETKE